MINQPRNVRRTENKILIRVKIFPRNNLVFFFFFIIKIYRFLKRLDFMNIQTRNQKQGVRDIPIFICTHRFLKISKNRAITYPTRANSNIRQHFCSSKRLNSKRVYIYIYLYIYSSSIKHLNPRNDHLHNNAITL